MKPYIICHMMSSVDGRTLTKNWGDLKGMNAYEVTGNSHNADAWICGRVTMEKDFAENGPLQLERAKQPMDRTDFVANKNARSFAIAVDQDGKLNWKQADIDGDHLITVLSESVSDSYLADLQAKGISYIFAGKIELDLQAAVEKLGDLFSIKKLLLEGGGHLNGSMLKAGLIDELSFLHLPVADGSPASPTLFEVDEHLEKGPVAKLKLIEVKQLDHDVLWIRYKIN